MSEKQETVADILAEMRGLVKPGETLNNTYELLNGLADRIEAAHKREIELVAARCCALGRLAGYGASEIRHKREIGNGAKMREALEALVKGYEVWDVCDYVGWGEERCKGCPQEALCKGIFDCKNALAEPARACDVLSANELKLQVFAGLAYQIKIKGFNIRGLEVLLKSVAGAVIDIAYDTNEEGKTND